MSEPNQPVATITMDDGGVIELALYPQHAPLTVSNFAALANDGFFDGQSFHRCVEGFVIQGGSPDDTCDGSCGFTIPGEFRANGVDNPLTHTRGAISMARDDAPDSAGCQFFIVHQDALRLDGKYAAFGQVIRGMYVVDRIAGTPTHDPDNTPDVRQGIKSVSVELRGAALPEPVRLPDGTFTGVTS